MNINHVTLIKGKFTYNSLFLRSLSSLAMNLFSLYSASSFRPPANTGIGGGSMIDMVFALLTLDEIWVFCVETILRLMLLSLLLLLFWLLLILAVMINISKYVAGWVYLKSILIFKYLKVCTYQQMLIFKILIAANCVLT